MIKIILIFCVIIFFISDQDFENFNKIKQGDGKGIELN